LTKEEALKLATDGLEKILFSFEKDGKVVMKAMIRNELFDEVNLLLKKAKKALAQPEHRNFCPRCGKRRGGDVNYIHTCTPPRGLEMT